MRADFATVDAAHTASSPTVWTPTRTRIARRAPALLRGVRMRAARDASSEISSGGGADHLPRRAGAQLTA